MIPRLAATALITLLVGCASTTPQPTPAPIPAPPPERPKPVDQFDGEWDWQVSSGELTIRVYRAGRLAHLGHNHVITSTALGGMIRYRADTPDQAYARLELALSSLVVDDPDARADAGNGFASQPSERDIAGTRANMLGPKLLQAEQHPVAVITVQAAGLNPTGQPEADVEIELAGQRSRHRLSAEMTVSESTLQLSSEFSLSHADLGLTPFSALGGAIRVAEDIDFALHLTATRL